MPPDKALQLTASTLTNRPWYNPGVDTRVSQRSTAAVGEAEPLVRQAARKRVNWDAIGATAELVAAVGVVLSLLYLAVQIRQNTASVRASTYQDFTRESADITRAALLDPAILEEMRPVLTGERSFEPTQDLRFGLIAGLYARNLQFGFLELQSGRIDNRHFDSYVSYHVENFMRRPGWSQWWSVNRRHYDPEFVRWVDSRLAA